VARLPKRYTNFAATYPPVAKAYESLGTACHNAGSLNDKTRALVKLALAVAARQEGGVHAQVRKALETGVTIDEMHHVALLAIPTIGFPPAMAAMSWIDDLAPAAVRGSRRKR
jgi:alkylhydroperoxidase/carboxymuconolactone decarboxylase family protein YurZ